MKDGIEPTKAEIAELKRLRRKIEIVQRKVDELQRRHRKITGVRHVWLR